MKSFGSAMVSLGFLALLLTYGHSAPGRPPDDSSTAPLGERLFFDKRLSRDQTVSCGSCHHAEKGFLDSAKVAIGMDRRAGTRNTPSLLNLSQYSSFFWDGRAGSLEEQVAFPLFNPIEHGLSSQDQLLSVLQTDSEYVTAFKSVFVTDTRPIRMENVAKAIAAYERTLSSGPSPFDRYFFDKKSAALSAGAIRGLGVFRTKAGCSGCHRLEISSAPFTDSQFHAGITQDYDLSEGLPAVAVRLSKMDLRARDQLISRDPKVAALGRFVVTLDPKDIGFFRTPTLRDVAITGPYMHDGSIATLEEAVDWELYARGPGSGRTIVLMPDERRWLLDFLNSLTGEAARSFQAK